MDLADAHIHFFSHRFFSMLAAQKPGLDLPRMREQLGWELPPEDPVDLARSWVREFDAHGVRRAAIMASLPGDEESVAAAVRAFPDRFYGYFMVNPLAEGAAGRVKAALEAGHLRVPCFFPAMHRYSLHDERAISVLEIVSATPSPVVFVHCGVLSVGVRTKLGLPSPFDLRFSNPIDVHGLATRFPHVRFVIPHFGAGFFREALMAAASCPNVYLDTSSSNQWMKLTEGDWTIGKVFHRALEVAGSQRLLFGSDSSYFPRGWHKPVFETQRAALETLGVSAEDQAAIFGGNLERLLAR